MDVTRKTDYALRMLTSLVCEPDRVISVRSVAEKNGIPYSFARSIQHDLSEAGIVTSTRGAHGGMRLAVDPCQITLLQVIQAIQGPVVVSSCDTVGVDGAECPRKEGCPFNPVWCGARRMLESYFASMTLDEAVRGVEPERIQRMVDGVSSGARA